MMAFFVQSWQSCQKVSLWAKLSESPGYQNGFDLEGQIQGQKVKLGQIF